MPQEHKMDAEDSQVEELRLRLKDKMSPELHKDKNMFLRFLRARSHNMDAAEAMLKNHIKWRREMKVDTILTEYVPHKYAASEYFPLNRIGFSLEGAPVSYLHFGNLDCKGMVKSIKNIEMQAYIAYYLEQQLVAMKESSAKTRKQVDQWVWIFDFENFSLTTATHKPTLEIFVGLVSLYEANYPESLKVAIAINTSYYFSLFWAVLKPFLSPPTANKVKIFGKTGWQEEVLKNVSPDVLPQFLGGKRTDPDGDPTCKSVLKFGGPVPESFFEYTNQTCAARIPGAKKLSVARMSRSEVPIRVSNPGSTLEWEFVVKNRDIGFSLMYRDGGGRGGGVDEELLSQQRIETSEATECGMYKCQKSGTYIIEFDNTYSWLHSKEIHYTVFVKDAIAEASTE